MRFGLIGLGTIGRVRKVALAKASGCSLTAVFDQDAARMTALPPGVIAFPSATALVASSACDAVIVSTPPNSHEQLAIAAMEHGKHVIVEKPMANSVEACRRMIDASRRSGRLLTVGFSHRYFDAIKVVREAVRSGAIGRLIQVRVYAGHVGLAEFKAPWMYDSGVMGGGTLMDNGIHIIDLAGHLMGTVDRVSGVVSADVWKLDVEDNAMVLLANHAGVIGSVQSSWSEWKGYRVYIEAYGEFGMARCDLAPMIATVITSDERGGRRRVRRRFYPKTILREKLFGWQSTAVRTFVEELRDFIALADDRNADCVIARGEDGLRAVEIAHAAYASSASGEAVTLRRY